VTHAVQQVIEEGEREADQHRAAERVDEEFERLVVGVFAARRSDQPISEQQQPDRQRTAGHAMQDRQGHRVLPAVHG